MGWVGLEGRLAVDEHMRVLVSPAMAAGNVADSDKADPALGPSQSSKATLRH